VDELVERAKAAGALGARIVGAGFGGSLIAAVRAAIGPDLPLMLDANHGYDAIEAIKLGRRVEAHDITWFEEPVPPEDLDGYREIKAAISIPVAGGECEYTRFGFRNVLQHRAIDILQPDTCAAGGLSECKKIADMASAFGVRYVPHVWGSAIGLAAALQLLAVLPRNPPGNRPLEPMLEFDRSEHPFRQAIVTAPIEHKNGVVTIPDGPGLGIEIDRAELERFKVA
jgi:D-galactarolactone cycloisomerase